MKVIQALKKIKDLDRKVGDLKSKIKDHCADLDNESPVYEDQRGQVGGWVQSIHDTIKEILRLRFCIQKTNILTSVKIEINGKPIERTIAEWIHRRRDLAALECSSWKMLTDRGLRPQGYTPTGNPDDAVFAKVRRYFDPKEKDMKIEEFTSEPSDVDSKLEVVNAETDLIEN